MSSASFESVKKEWLRKAIGSSSRASENAGNCRAAAASPTALLLVPRCVHRPVSSASATPRTCEVGSLRATCEHRSGAANPSERKAENGKMDVLSSRAFNCTRCSQVSSVGRDGGTAAAAATPGTGATAATAGLPRTALTAGTDQSARSAHS